MKFFRRKKSNIIPLQDLCQLLIADQKLRESQMMIHNLILGSSHARYGYYESPFSVNFGFGSQDLYYSHQLYLKLNNLIPHLKNVILFFSAFSPGNCLLRNPNRRRCLLYKHFLDIPYKNHLYAMELGLAKLRVDERDRLYRKARVLIQSLNPAYPDLRKEEQIDINNSSIEEEVSKILKLNRKKTELPHLKALCRDSIAHGRNLYLVLSPYHKDLKSLLPPSDILFKDAFCLSKQLGTPVINLYDYEGLHEEHFHDRDHLNITGAQVAANYIDSHLE